VATGVVGSVAGRALTAVAASPIPLPSTRLRDIDEAGEQLVGAGAWVAFFVVVCIGAPFFEELLFRGLLQPRLVGRYGAVAGIGVTSVLFGAAHLLGWTGPFTLASAWAVSAGGLALGVVRHYSDRLGPAILAHAFFNLQVFVLVVLAA
jgi:membrane protease YdiL (CAAX protease family)